MNGTLSALLVAAAFGIAVANACSATRWLGVAVFAATAALIAFAPIPAAWSARVHLACWIAIVACSASVHAPNAIGLRVSIALALAASVTGGSVAGLASTRAIVVLLPLIATTVCVASHAVVRRVPLAPKVVSSWLIAVALLAATLQMLPVTPGYLPDHLE